MTSRSFEAAVAAAADVIVTGDKHFLSLALDLPGPSPPAASSTPTPGSAKIERSESPAESLRNLESLRLRYSWTRAS